MTGLYVGYIDHHSDVHGVSLWGTETNFVVETCAESEIMNKSITFFAIFPVRCAGIEYFCVILQRSSEHRLIEITKRYARLADGNVGNFQCNARTVITVRAYSVDWLLHLHYKAIPTASVRRSG